MRPNQPASASGTVCFSRVRTFTRGLAAKSGRPHVKIFRRLNAGVTIRPLFPTRVFSASKARKSSPPMTSSTPSPQEMTELLAAWSDGDREALDRLLPLVERELHPVPPHYISRQ